MWQGKALRLTPELDTTAKFARTRASVNFDLTFYSSAFCSGANK